MIFYDFHLEKYNNHLANPSLIVSNLFERDGRNLKDILYDISIAHSTYRLAKLNNFVDNEKFLSRVFEYYKIDILPEEVVKELNESFNKFFTAIYYVDMNAINSTYQEIMEKRDIVRNSFLLPIIEISDFLFKFVTVRMSRSEMLDALTEIIDKIHEFEAFYFDEFKLCKELVMSYYFALKNFKKEYLLVKNEILYDLEVYPKFSGLFLFNLAVTSYWVDNILNAVMYSKQAILIYNKDNCLSRLNRMKINLILFYIIGHSPYEARQIISSVECYNQYSNNTLTEELLSTYKCYVLIEEQKYDLAIETIKCFFAKYKSNEMNVYLAYCYYMNKDINGLTSLYNELQELHDTGSYFSGYYYAVKLIYSFASKEPKKNIPNLLKEFKKASLIVPNAYYYHLIYREVKDY